MDFVLRKEFSDNNRVYVDLVSPKKISEVKKISPSNKIIVIKTTNDDISRSCLENKNIDILLGLESCNSRDFIHYRNSGLNQVLCKLAKKNNVAIGFSFNDILNNEKKEIVLGRMMQNVMLCRKYKLKIVIGSFASKDIEIKNKSELMSFGKVIGMNGSEIRQSLNFKKKEGLIKIIK